MAFDPFAAFTGSGFDQAARDTQDAFARLSSNVTGIANTAQSTGLGALGAARTGALGAIGSGYGQARTDVSGALDPALTALYGGQNRAAGAVTGSVNPAIDALYGGVAGTATAYDPLYRAAVGYGNYGDNAAQMYADANGLNGPEGTARAQAAFQASPGAAFQREQAIQGAVRGANVGGGALGGNTLDAVTRLSSNLANQDYGNWLQRTLQQAQLYSPLQADALKAYGAGTGTAALTAGTKAADIYGTAGGRLADLYSTTGVNAANLRTGTAKTLADIATGGANAGSGAYLTTGQTAANLINSLAGQQIGFNQAQLNPLEKTFADQAYGTQLGSKNLWDFIGNAATAGTKGIAGLPSNWFASLGVKTTPSGLYTG